MSKIRTGLTALSLLLVSACAREAPVAQPQAVAPSDSDALPAFVGKIWVSVTPGHARGSILVFLPDKSVLRGSCWEPFRVSKWGIISDNRIRWIEDTIPIEAEYSQPSARELELRPVGTKTREDYVTISVPYVCPSMPR